MSKNYNIQLFNGGQHIYLTEIKKSYYVGTSSNDAPLSDFFIQNVLAKHGRLASQIVAKIHYWIRQDCGVVKNERRWIYNTLKQWSIQLGYSPRSLMRGIQVLKDAGILLVEKLSPNPYNKTNYYTIDYEAVGYSDFKKKNPAKPQKSSWCQNGSIYIHKIRSNKSNKSRKNNATSKGEKKMVETNLPNTLVRQMAEIWHKKVSSQKGLPAPRMNVYLSGYLVACFISKFDKDMKKWEQFCQLVASSSYLMGKDFALSLGWATKYHVIDRILSGELGVNLDILSVQQNTDADCEIKAIEHIDGVNEDIACKEARKAVLELVGAKEYNAWFTKVDFVENGSIFKPHNRFVEDVINNRFGHIIKKTVAPDEG